MGQFARKRLLVPADAEFEQYLRSALDRGIDTRLARIVRTPREAARAVPLYLDFTEDAVRFEIPTGARISHQDGSGPR